MPTWFRLMLCGVLGGISLVACNGTPPPATPPPAASPIAASATVAATPTPPPDPRGVAAQYLAAWQSSQYAAMYGWLAADSRATLTADAFEKEYRKWLEVMTVTGLTAEVGAVQTAADSAQVTAQVQYTTTLVGPLTTIVTLPLKREADGWRVVFSRALIWPEMVNGQTLLMATVPTERGNLYDRNGQPLAKPADAFAIGVVPGQLGDTPPATFTGLARLMGLPLDQLMTQIQAAVPDQYLALTEASAQDYQKLAYLADVPGVVITPYTSRFYAGNGAAASVTGYTSFIQADELEAYRAKGYTGSERVGRAGLEGWGESYLAGRTGGQLQLRDPDNHFIKMVAQTQPVASQDIYATIDLGFQQAVQAALDGLTGGIVVLDLHTGEVLALASSPTFSPNLFDPQNRNNTALSQALNDPRRPLLNHAAQSSYPAGSVFKIVTLSAGLTSGLFTPDTEYTCNGEWNETSDPSFTRTDWLAGGHGTLTLTQGLSASCNPWFWHVGFALFNWNPRWLSQTARAFGLGQATRIGQIAESPGLIPDPDWKQQVKGEAWSAIDGLNLSIGQGDVLVTPLQIARLVAAVGNGGALYQPQLVKAIRPTGSPDAAPTFSAQPILSGTLPLKPEQLTALQTGMINVTKDPIGTARNRFRGFRLCVAGKTGTAEDPGLSGLQDPDAWFAGYTCAQRSDKPDIAVAVVVQNQGQGSDYAAPIFRRVLEAYFGLPFTRYPWEDSVGVPKPTATGTPAAGAPSPTSTATPKP